MSNLSFSGSREAGLETIRMTLNTAPEGNLNIAYRSNSKLVLILLTGNFFQSFFLPLFFFLKKKNINALFFLFLFLFLFLSKMRTLILLFLLQIDFKVQFTPIHIGRVVFLLPPNLICITMKFQLLPMIS